MIKNLIASIVIASSMTGIPTDKISNYFEVNTIKHTTMENMTYQNMTRINLIDNQYKVLVNQLVNKDLNREQKLDIQNKIQLLENQKRQINLQYAKTLKNINASNKIK